MTPVLPGSQGPKDPLPDGFGSPSPYPTSSEARFSLLRTFLDVRGGSQSSSRDLRGWRPFELEGFPSPNSPSFPTPSM